jgi:Xaa-Pro aminopeptidase
MFGLSQNTIAKLSKRSGLPILSKFLPNAADGVNAAALAGYKRAQGLAFECAVETAKTLKVGMTEKDMTDFMDSYLRDNGVVASFHRPLAWFGDRTRFKGFKSEKHAFPTDRKLENPTDYVVFDLAPILGGFIGDIGFGFTLEPNPVMIEGRKFLLELREEIARLFATSMTAAEIWKKVDEMVVDRGYENCHKKYQFKVLGHRVNRVPLDWIPSKAGIYSLHGYWALASRGLFSELLSPWHEGEKKGLWAIEPHIGLREQGFGSKFEEILVVGDGEAHWLTDDVPHLKMPAGLN